MRGSGPRWGRGKGLKAVLDISFYIFVDIFIYFGIRLYLLMSYAVMHDWKLIMILYRIPILGRGIIYQMIFIACLPVCGMSMAYTLVRGTPVLGVVSMSFLV